MNDLMGFEFGGHPVRVVMVDGEPWWVAQDVCDVLGYASAGDNVTQILQRIDDDEKLKISISSNNNPVANFKRPVWCVSEPGLYALILWAQIPAAHAFKRWVTREVLPQIRRTGSYQVGNAREIVVAKALALANEILSEFRGKAKAKELNL